MSYTYTFIFWSILLIMSMVAETVTLQLVSLWFAVGALFALIAELFDVSFHLQILIFIGVSIFTLLLIRPILKKLLRFKKEVSGAKRLIGKTAKVVFDIDNSTGQGEVNVEGEVWSAKSINGETINKNEAVKIDGISGVKVIVHKI